jgi:hypothetical protein
MRDEPYACFSRSFPFSPFQPTSIVMALHVFVFLLVVCPSSRWRSSGVWTGSLFGLPPQKVRPNALRTTVGSSPAPLTITPPVDSPTLLRWMGTSAYACASWCEVKSRSGASKRIDAAGFACSNHQCLYFGITDARVYASFGGWQG